MAHVSRGQPAASRPCGSRSVENEFLDAEIGKLADKESVFGTAVDGVDRPKFLEQPSGPAKFAKHRSIQPHPIYLAGDIDIVPRIGIGNVENRIGSPADAHRLCVAEVGKRGLEDAVIVEHLDALVAAIAGVDVALRVQVFDNNGVFKTAFS